MRWEDVTDDVEALFYKADKNNDNKISLNELERMFTLLGIKISTYDAKRIIKTFDKDNSKRIELNEFRKLMKLIIESDHKYQEAWEAFHVIDMNDNMLISRNEIKQVCNILPKPMSDEQIQEMFTMMDEDKNGVINFDEFAKAYALGIAGLGSTEEEVKQD